MKDDLKELKASLRKQVAYASYLEDVAAGLQLHLLCLQKKQDIISIDRRTVSDIQRKLRADFEESYIEASDRQEAPSKDS